MKKFRILCVVLTLCILLTSLYIPASASEYDARLGESLGGINDQTGYFLPDDFVVSPYGNPVGVDKTLFSMTVTGVSGMITTYGKGKSFTRSSLPSDGVVYFSGILTHSLAAVTPNTEMRAGICTYDIIHDMFNPFDYVEGMTSGKAFTSDTTGVTSFDKNKTYYGYIKNVSESGEVSGTVTFYVIDYT